MANPAQYPSTVEAIIRAHFGLTQRELARYLGVSAGFIAHLEAGRKTAPMAALERLTKLAALLPAPQGRGPIEPPAPVATPANPAALPDSPTTPLLDEPLRRRLLDCRLRAAVLTLELMRLQA